jgi:hypothetical protein
MNAAKSVAAAAKIAFGGKSLPGGLPSGAALR